MVIEKGIVYNCRGKVLHVCTLMLGLYMEESSPYHTGNHESDFATARQLLYNNIIIMVSVIVMVTVVVYQIRPLSEQVKFE